MLIASDLDGTIDSNPREMQSILSALKAAGHTVVIVTGSSGGDATQDDWQEKATYLNSLGCGECWDRLVVIGHPAGTDLPTLKAQWCADNDVDVLVDNDKDNARAATGAGIPLVLVPWASRQ